MSENNFKVFVGNVPFQGQQDEFVECFKNVPGFIHAEIVTRYNSPYSRGFGFVTLKTENDAKILMDRSDIVFKDRVLRFTKYNLQDHKIKSKNYLFVKNVPLDMNRDRLKNIFQSKNVGACFINTNIKTGESKGNAIVEIKDEQIFDKLVADGTFTDGQYTFEIAKWKNKVKRKPKIYNKQKIDTKDLYRIAFNAGVNVGRLEGLQIANNKKFDLNLT